jgi:hypothetical protein
LDARLIFTSLDRSLITSSVHLCNVVHLEASKANDELRLILAVPGTSHSRQSPKKTTSILLRFDNSSSHRLWADALAAAIQQAKDQRWKMSNELII